MLLSSIVFALASAVALLALLLKLNIRRCLGYDAAIDIICTIILISAFQGTVTGMAAAMFAGVFISLVLLIIKMCIGYERIKYENHRFHWVRYEPVWTQNLARRVHDYINRKNHA